jgi:uncharacterized membrane protein YcaP (DUF421 family)
MWHLNSTWYDPLFRGIVIYLFLFLLIKLFGKKKLSKYTPFDLILLFLTAQMILIAIMREDHGPLSTLLTVVTLITLHTMRIELTLRSSWFLKIMEGQPEVIILNGKIHKKVMKREKLSEADLFEALREHEVMKTEDIKCAILETDGKISIIKYNH